MARVDPAVAAARNAVRAVLAELGPDDLVLVACSGGADSLALAAATAYEAGRVGRSVRSRGYAVRAGAVIVDHGLQPGSAEVAARAAARCEALGLAPVLIRRAAWPAGASAGSASGSAAGERRDRRSLGADAAMNPTFGAAGPEGAAREARYRAITESAQESGARLVLLGHTLDDQAEQVLLGLARGAGARSLAGMPRERGIFRRPFLGLRRAQTEAVCAALGLEFWTDPTNLAPPAGPRPEEGAAGVAFVPLRSRVRAHVLPALEDTLGPGVAEALGRTADQLRDDADLLDTLASDLLARARREPDTPEPGLDLDVAVLEDAHRAVRRRALRLAALAAGCPPTDTTARHVEALDALVVAWAGQGPVHLPGGARARRACGRLFLRAAPTGTPDGPGGVRPPSTTQE
ncbi:ATP-binding protein [Promicromonospora thailandica]|uniref:tRNA(Ile)-lysidine synthase n=1 Tax=Promicromonospora thailandica TaxID=765201 RepID=A0A9X2G6V9_9MICO|nr:tRNA lysidine(34) synthetase [Promicromonospora thailandica]MCP2266457.1 tRNA(Ile)-lysidine synthase [Promicromonospora thailandica]